VSDDELFRKRRPRKQRESGGSSGTANTLLMAFGILAAVGVLACCGLVGAGYYFWQKNFSQIALTQPADIQKLTAEMTDISIPPEFVPQNGTALLGNRVVMYQWCPTGTCPPVVDEMGSLSLMGFSRQLAGNGDVEITLVSEEQYTDELLQHSWLEYAKSVEEVDIRGKKCKFFIVRGEQLDFASMMPETGDEDDEDGGTVVTAEAPGGPPANAPPAPERKGTGRKTVQISGSFPGKTGEVTLNIHLPEADYQEEKILGMLRSIR
jgi:hypothetical protein